MLTRYVHRRALYAEDVQAAINEHSGRSALLVGFSSVAHPIYFLLTASSHFLSLRYLRPVAHCASGSAPAAGSNGKSSYRVHRSPEAVNDRSESSLELTDKFSFEHFAGR